MMERQAIRIGLGFGVMFVWHRSAREFIALGPADLLLGSAVTGGGVFR